MQLPNGTVLMHGSAPYDPLKAHEYYLKTRHLKGRKSGQGKNPVYSLPGFKKSQNRLVTVTLPNGKTFKLTHQQLTEQKVYAAARINHIKQKLAILNTELKKRIAAAQTQTHVKKPLSPAQKALVNRKAKAYTATNKQKLATKKHQKVGIAKGLHSTTTSQKQLAGLRVAIAGAQHALTAAVAKQRALATAK